MKYEMRHVLASLAVEKTSPTPEQVRHIVATRSDVPADRIEACVAEMDEGGVIEGVRALVALEEAVTGERPDYDTILDRLPTAIWIDDDKGNIDVAVNVESEEGEHLGSAKVHRNLRTGASSVEANVKGERA